MSTEIKLVCVGVLYDDNLGAESGVLARVQ